ncbi:hypothetical protein FGO68_gene1763 [Halteria grandinella]|uniref:Uncharacterized protein n=1 Tax=Halteria grandinella TaxID=5974 RepID=A0A8J8P619_HALGN|nr:hypothetical protein FGO68_gene1763 [Halteria grandinella]
MKQLLNLLNIGLSTVPLLCLQSNCTRFLLREQHWKSTQLRQDLVAAESVKSRVESIESKIIFFTVIFPSKGTKILNLAPILLQMVDFTEHSWPFKQPFGSIDNEQFQSSQELSSIMGDEFSKSAGVTQWSTLVDIKIVISSTFQFLLKLYAYLSVLKISQK